MVCCESYYQSLLSLNCLKSCLADLPPTAPVHFFFQVVSNYYDSMFSVVVFRGFPPTALCRVPSNCLLIYVMFSADLSTSPHSCFHLCSIRYLRIYLIPLFSNVPLVTHIIYHCIVLIEFVLTKKRRSKCLLFIFDGKMGSLNW